MSLIRPKKAIRATLNQSELGKDVSFYSATAVITSVMLGHSLPHTIFVSTYRDFIRLYSKGFSVPVPEKVNERFDKTLELLQIDQDERSRFSTFMACGFDIVSAGTFGKFGVHIGIPVNYGYENVDSIDKSKIMVNQESVIWDSDAGKQLLNALVVPEKAQLFAIAREIKIRDSLKLYFDTFYATMSCAITYLGSGILNEKLNLHSQPRKVRFAGYTLMAMLNAVNYVMCKDLTQNLYDAKIDKELKNLSPVFAEGGRQFYSTILERNKALRKLMGTEGESMYTVLGNENFLIRNKHRPIVQRKAFFEEDLIPEEATLQEILE